MNDAKGTPGGPQATAQRLVRTLQQQRRGAAAPTVLHVLPVRAYEIDFEALEFVVDAGLPPVDRAVLELVRALRTASEDDLRAYLGLGGDLSSLIAARLVQEGVLQRHADAAAPVALERVPTRAHLIEVLGRTAAASLTLTQYGVEILDGRARHVSKKRPARLVFWEQPLHFVEVHGESTGRFSARRRPSALAPDSVPEAFWWIDDMLRESPEIRLASCGVAERLPGFEGVLVGCVPGAAWEVRCLEDRSYVMAVAGFLRDGETLVWQTWAGSERNLRECQRLQGLRLVPQVTARELIDAARAHWPVDARDPWAPDTGALNVRCNGTELIRRLGEAAHPQDSWEILEVARDHFTVVRLRGLPVDADAAYTALAAILARREPSMRRDLDGTIADTWAELARYWGVEDIAPPSRAWLLARLWNEPAMRGVLCGVRLREDLVTPYNAPRGSSLV